MSNLDDIFDLPEGAKQYMNNEDEPKQVEKKPRKKPELSEEKKNAMLERLRAGREKRQENLKATKASKEPNNQRFEEPKEVKKEKEVTSNKNNNVLNNAETERLSFINMMAGKSKPVEKFERPKKKVQSEQKEKDMKEDKPKNTESKIQEEKPTISIPIISETIARQPVIIRTFKKPIWA